MTFEERLNEEIPRLKKFCTRLAGSKFSRDEELLQNALNNAWRSRDSFKEDCQVYSWLCIIATNAFKDILRMESRRIKPLALDNNVSYMGTKIDQTFNDVLCREDENYSKVERQGVAKKLIDTVIPKGTACYTVALESIVYGMDLEEIEKSHGISRGAARSRVFRANALLRKAVEENPELLVDYGVYA